MSCEQKVIEKLQGILVELDEKSCTMAAIKVAEALDILKSKETQQILKIDSVDEVK